ncbi:MAG: xanthine dehydrogenase family protein subunit M [Anaerolineae bacterium]|nr:xanthine dehydrogenase family protein subunit M [Anaerolineae bacterium]
MKLWNHYHTPKTPDEAITLLHQYAGQARIIAGGTDLLVDMRAEGHEPIEALIDITRIPQLNTIEISPHPQPLSQVARGANDTTLITIGAGVTHTQIVKSAVIAERATCLVESCGVVGGPQVRNVATLGGNVAHALPAGDGTTSLVALDAEAEIILKGQQKWVPLTDLFLGPGESLLDPTHDLLVRFRFKACGKDEGSAFKRIMRPQGVALPILGCAVWVRLDTAGTTFEAARISIAPAGPRPGRAQEIEQFLNGKPATAETIEQAAALAQERLHPRTSKYRATADYRKEMIGVLLRRTLPLAVKRAQTGEAVPEGVGM